MKKLLLIVLILLPVISLAQNGSNTPWTWINGDKIANQVGVYGTQGTSSPLNKPGGRNYSATWTDTNGNLWLLGGLSPSGGYLNDLWKYNSTNNMWTWIKGSSLTNQAGIYGLLGISNIVNTPGARAWAVSWIDNDNNLWLFGGWGYASTSSGNHLLNDLWKYNPVTNEWTWVKGSMTLDPLPSYGILGISSSTNVPGGRYTSAGWKDLDGNFWVFGGLGIISAILNGDLNDLWKYNPVTNEWTWVKGDNNLLTPNGNYGTLALPAATNKPGSRESPCTWIDNSGNLWMFGGWGRSSIGTSREELSDLWMYNIVANTWIWINGDNIGNQPGIYGTQGIPNSSNKPGGRDGHNGWKDADGNFWLFGGYDPNGNLYNDLWMYNVTANIWTWVKGDNATNQNGVYGSLGIPALSNKPGGRNGFIVWRDDLYNFWLFGGSGKAESSSGFLNDLWKINSNSLIPLTLLQFTGYTNSEENLLYWQTAEEINTDHFAIESSPDGITFFSIGNVKAKGGNSIKNHYYFSDRKFSININFYKLKSIDINGEYSYSKVIAVKRTTGRNNLTIFPTPANNILHIYLKNVIGPASIQILDESGRKIKENNVQLNRNISFSIDIADIQKGIYFLTIRNSTQIFQQKFIKN